MNNGEHKIECEWDSEELVWGCVCPSCGEIYVIVFDERSLRCLCGKHLLIKPTRLQLKKAKRDVKAYLQGDK